MLTGLTLEASCEGAADDDAIDDDEKLHLHSNRIAPHTKHPSE